MRWKLQKRWALELAVVTAFAFAATSFSVSGCFTHQCDPSCRVLGGPATSDCPLGDGGLEDGGIPSAYLRNGALVWESSEPDPVSGPTHIPWLDLAPQRTFRITFPQPFACIPEVKYDLTADLANPQEGGFINGGADLVQFSHQTTTGIFVTNPSCAEYGLRLVITGLPAPPLDTSGDASTETSGDVSCP